MLMDKNRTEISNNMEIQKTVPHAWLFDVDGVITNPKEKRVTHPEILEEIAKRLENGEPVALVTGRSLEWVSERVADPLKARISNKKLLDNLFVSGEFGGSYIEYKDGNEKHFIDHTIEVPSEVVEEAKTISQEFENTMMWDQTKKTMVSIEMKDGIDVHDFSPPQVELVEKLTDLLRRKGLKDTYQVHKDLIATNIMRNGQDKAFAAKRVLSWLKEKGAKPQQFIAFGDSASDLEMAQEIHEKGFSVEFVFVGDPAKIQNQSRGFPISISSDRYEKGTLEYFKQN